MNLSHYLYLYPAYAIAIFGWVLYSKRSKLGQYSMDDDTIYFKKPWLEFILAFVAGIITILIGQLYLKGLLFSNQTSFIFITESINQILIFSPFLILLLIRKQSLTTAWIPERNKLKSILAGLMLALVALLTFILLRGRTTIIDDILSIYSYKNLPQLVQVLAEDFMIAICLVRLIAWIGSKKAIIIIACLFAIGHIPAMITNGVSIENFTSLIFDTVLGVFVLNTLSKSKNFLWFWMIHYAMDMTQFVNH